MTFGEFRIHKGGIIEFDNKNVEPDDKNHTVRSFALVSRYLAHMLNCMSDEDKKSILRITVLLYSMVYGWIVIAMKGDSVP